MNIIAVVFTTDPDTKTQFNKSREMLDKLITAMKNHVDVEFNNLVA